MKLEEKSKELKKVSIKLRKKEVSVEGDYDIVELVLTLKGLQLVCNYDRCNQTHKRPERRDLEERRIRKKIRW